MFAVRGSEFAHQVRFGSGGALIVSLDISGEQFEALDAEEVGRWNPGSQRLVQGVLASVLRRDSRADIEDCVWEVMAGPPSEAALVAPPWLAHARDRLIEESAAIGELAADAGVHRVYFSRFHACLRHAPDGLSHANGGNARGRGGDRRRSGRGKRL